MRTEPGEEIFRGSPIPARNADCELCEEDGGRGSPYFRAGRRYDGFQYLSLSSGQIIIIAQGRLRYLWPRLGRKELGLPVVRKHKNTDEVLRPVEKPWERTQQKGQEEHPC